MKKVWLLCGIVLLALGVSACGTESKTVDSGQLADELLAQVDFEDELTELGEDMIPALYGVEGASEQRVYMSSGATAEEIAVFLFPTEEAAQAGQEALEQRLESRRADFANYMPDEASRLENAVLERSGCCVALCVAAGDEARQIIGKYLG